MGHYYHALPVNGGLQVPAENLEELVTKINEVHEGDPGTQLALNPTDAAQAMEELRQHGFYIHQENPRGGVTLAGWGIEGNPYDGYPKRGMKIHNLHPGEIIELFHQYSNAESDGGVLAYDDYDDYSLYYAKIRHRMRQDEHTIHLEDVAVIKEFFNPKDYSETVLIMQQAPAKDSPFDEYPAVTMKTNDFKEVQDFYYECAKKAQQGSRGDRPLIREDHSNTLSNEEMKRIKDKDKKLIAQITAKHGVRG